MNYLNRNGFLPQCITNPLSKTALGFFSKAQQQKIPATRWSPIIALIDVPQVPNFSTDRSRFFSTDKQV